MKTFNPRTIVKSWKFAFLLFFLTMSYIIFNAITDYDSFNQYFKINSSLTGFVNFILIILLMFLMVYSNIKKVLKKKSILIYLLIILYSLLQIWNFVDKFVFSVYPSYSAKHSTQKFDIASLSLNNPKHFTYKLALSADFILAIFSLVFLLVFLIRKHSLKLIELNNSVYNSFLSYLKTLSNEFRHSISILFSNVKAFSFYALSKINFIYITNFIKIIKCSLKQDRVDHSFNLI